MATRCNHQVGEYSLKVPLSLQEGKQLEDCDDAYNLVILGVHAQIGYVAAMSNQYVQRDISIRCNHVLQLRQKAYHRPLDKHQDNGDAPENFNSWEHYYTETLAKESPGYEVQAAKGLQATIGTLGISNECAAVWSDVDIAATNLGGYFQKPRANPSELSGTREFMSLNLLQSQDVSELAGQSESWYLHNIVDDFHAFFHTILWAAFFNKNRNRGNDVVNIEVYWQIQLRGNHESRHSVNTGYLGASRKRTKTLSPMLRAMRGFLRAWNGKLEVTSREAEDAFDDIPPEYSDEVAGEYRLALSNYYAFRGVREYLETVEEFREQSLLK